jgi:hypothetical protein
MRTIAMSLFIAAVSLTPAVAQGFLNLPATGAWVKVHEGKEGDIILWSARSPIHPDTRIDLVSYLEDGKRDGYYVVRSACSDGKTVATAVIKPGKALGLGADCNGRIVAKSSMVLDEVQKLPPEAAALLKR